MVTSVQPKPKKSAATKKPKSSPSHPPFAEMINDAVVSLQERTGSSQYAITKFIEEKHKQLPSNFRKLLLYYLKKSVAAGKLVKVKNSFKLPLTRSAPTKKLVDAKAAKPTAKTASKPQPEASGKSKVAAKPKAAPKSKTTAAASPKAAAKPAKVTKASARTSLGKKVLKAAKGVKKPKSVKSPVKKAAVKKAKK